MNETDVAWLAGLIEGEGCFGKYHYGTRTKTLLQIEMNDLDVIERVKHITGCGNIRVKPPRKNSKQSYCWTVTRREDVESIAHAVYPYMGTRRQEKISSMFDALVA